MKKINLIICILISVCYHSYGQWTTTTTPNGANVLTNGNVCIGCTSVVVPPERLHLIGNFRINGSTDILSTTPLSFTGGAVSIGNHHTTTSSKSWLQSYNTATSYTPFHLNPKGGAVGIGVTTSVSNVALQVDGLSLFKNKMKVNGSLVPGSGDDLLTIVGGDIKIIETDDYSTMPDQNSADVILTDKVGGTFNFYQGFSSGLMDVHSSALRIGRSADPATSVTIYPTGQMAIGGESPGVALKQKDGYMLFVKQGIMSEKLTLALSTDAVKWSDYVFEDDYCLPALHEVEQFVKQNRHLPDVPAASDIYANGIDVAQMDATLLRKIEELTLYVIEHQKMLDEVKRAIK